MLDANYTLLSYVANNNQKINKVLKALILETCRVYVFSQGRVYSEFEEFSFDYLNSNDFGFGTLQIEFEFVNGVTENPYPDFYTKCFKIRTDNDLTIKPIKIGNQKSYSKVNDYLSEIINILCRFCLIIHKSSTFCCKRKALQITIVMLQKQWSAVYQCFPYMSNRNPYSN